MNTAQQNEIEKIDMATDIVVIGSGYIGLKAASQISESGYNVILAPQHNDTGINFSVLDVPSTEIDHLKALETKVANNTNVEILPISTLVEAAGSPGDFTLKFLSAGTVVEKKAGAVIVATETAVNPLNHIYGLNPAANVVSLSEFEKHLAAEDTKK
jgi:heterodisulfide reductase subunit A-like polyferredoxin